ncbi:ATP-dependent nuclease [Bradyrhizobium sp. CCBAU 53380]|uniref:ATP-dependent nuclease n=1 Tax=Bradyrhizobium sp. CCBAU 53380 TaxID=1325117 RepID=UPI00230488E2|nr:ATP-binding protein [Bradyrhizobium sp. CCBAU 53380]MDA9426232.1 ATP-dependent OLD family endonuclease [Bradyrhizobium sp. CCBAU 53380]
MPAILPISEAPLIRRFVVKRFRGLHEFEWRPAPGLNVILGGGDVGKTTILEAIALLLSPTTSSVLSDADYWDRKSEDGFEIEAVMSLTDECGINQQTKQAWPWDWNGKEPILPGTEQSAGEVARPETPVYRLRVSGNSDYELAYELVQPDGTTSHLAVAVRRSIGLVRLGGDDRNDRDLRLVQGSALDRLLSDATLRSRLGKLLGDADVEEGLKDEAKQKLEQLNAAFQTRALPSELGLALMSGQGLSIGALVGLTADRHGVSLPLASWGSGTRRLSSLEIAAAHQAGSAITVVDEVERGLEPYRLRGLIGRLQDSKYQVFLTTHSSVAISAANKASLWYLDSSGAIGSLPKDRISRHQKRDPETFLARLTIVAEGECEKGFLHRLFERASDSTFRERGIWVTEAGGNDSSLDLLETLAGSGMLFGGFVDDEGRDPQRWKALTTRLGKLLFRWDQGCLEQNIIKHIPADRLEKFIEDLEGDSGDRRRTLADRLGLPGDKSFAAIRTKAPDLHALIIDAAMGVVPDAIADKGEKKQFKEHQKKWFKSYEGGRELADKVFSFGVWPHIKDRLLPFLNAVRAIDGLPPLSDLP